MNIGKFGIMNTKHKCEVPPPQVKKNEIEIILNMNDLIIFPPTFF